MLSCEMFVDLLFIYSCIRIMGKGQISNMLIEKFLPMLLVNTVFVGGSTVVLLAT